MDQYQELFPHPLLPKILVWTRPASSGPYPDILQLFGVRSSLSRCAPELPRVGSVLDLEVVAFHYIIPRRLGSDERNSVSKTTDPSLGSLL